MDVDLIFKIAAVGILLAVLPLMQAAWEVLRSLL